MLFQTFTGMSETPGLQLLSKVSNNSVTSFSETKLNEKGDTFVKLRFKFEKCELINEIDSGV